MQRSESVSELVKALCAAQAEIEGAVKDKENSHFQSSYADLGAVWEAIRAPLTKHGLSVVQFPRACEMGVEVETTLFHSSGQFMSDTLALPVSKRDAHGFGSAITYARRYALMAVAGIAPVDDDGNGATGREPSERRATPPAPPQVKTAAPAAVPPKPAMTAKQWADNSITAIKKMATTQAVNDWRAANKDDIEKLATKAPAEHTRLTDTINERLDMLRPQAAE